MERAGRNGNPEVQQGDEVKAVVLEVDPDKERISLGIKQLEADPFTELTGGLTRGQVVTCEVTSVQDNGVEVKLAGTDMTAFIRRSDLSRDRSDQRPDRFSVGDKIDAAVSSIDAKTRRVSLSIKQQEIAEEKEAVEQFGSSASGASLGDILGAALKERGGDAEPEAENADAEKTEDAKDE